MHSPRNQGGRAALRLLSRKRVRSLLALSERAASELFPAAENPGRCIPEATVLAFLNARRTASPEISGPLPQLLTEKDVVRSVAIEIDGKPLTTQRLRRLCNSVRMPIPHFRLLKHGGYRFYPGAVQWWASYLHKGIYLSLVPKYSYGASPYEGPDLGYSLPAHRRAGLFPDNTRRI